MFKKMSTLQKKLPENKEGSVPPFNLFCKQRLECCALLLLHLPRTFLLCSHTPIIIISLKDDDEKKQVASWAKRRVLSFLVRPSVIALPT